MRIVGATHAGVKRSNNQDTFLCGETDWGGYLIVCDGMGGERGGNVASAIAAETFRDMLLRDVSAGMSGRQLRAVMTCAAAAANAAVFDAAKEDAQLTGMGTTLVAAVVFGGCAVIIHAGDSRAYLLREDVLTQLTTDHTFVQILVSRGDITRKAASEHPQRHYITRAVGVQPELEFDFTDCALLPGDCLLLCSDGLYNEVPEEELAALTAVAARLGSPEGLIRRANENGGGDNITAVLAIFTQREGQHG